MQQQDNSLTDIYKDVVIIGNGPSGICLSYLLAGNWPHYTGEAHKGDEMLTARLRYSVLTHGCSLNGAEEEVIARESEFPVYQKALREKKDYGSHCLVRLSQRKNLERLSSGLEGRNNGKPLSLLMDQLQHPCLDAGLDMSSLLDWKSPEEHVEHRPIDHVLLGKGPSGGTWHALDPNVLTISLNRWMSLPGLDLRQWKVNLDAEEREQKLPYFNSETEIGTNCSLTRVPIGTVAAYYKDYVMKQGLDKYIRCGTVVTSVKAIPCVANNEKEYGWLVQGYETETGQTFQYRCKRVVLATGTTDLSNRLGVSGEETYNWVTHDYQDFERKLDRLNCPLRTNVQINNKYDPVEAKANIEPLLIIGSGLSAADAIMAARSRGISVLHVFRSNSKDRSGKMDRKKNLDKLRWLPASVYPEYHRVYEMMADKGRNYHFYKSLPDHVVIDFSASADKYTRTKMRKVTLCTPQGRLISYRVSFAAVFIGSKPDLSYLQNNGIGLGKVEEKRIDSRSNPIDVDVFTYQVTRAPRKGLYAIGPLVGDNFVRFILGGAFGVLASILHTPE
ncbi:PREDICTED: oxidative stress-induced growth inhibitor 2-like [Ceratosolen solmsi marchali]|uniref:Oxidative stress-induced growth inhibitor 2-like n=1 Tax=Ceratosolen solmsi marchali TaxID=326594 RepID=A0AAJ6YL98_9HYME|nr:PREDICTED: oxidative stress-induced growth inhibitor 2-like [Ceratosolen solmsi marchali]